MLRTTGLFILSCLLFLKANAQGCSDAGFCTAGALHTPMPGPDSLQKDRGSIAFSGTVGKGENSTRISIFQAEGRFAISPGVMLEAKISCYNATGDLGSHTGIGDPIITCSGNLWQRKNLRLTGVAGLRVSLGKSDAGNSAGHPLPMPYQSNLGTTDLITGLTLSWKNYLSIAAGWQQPIVQYNDNGYDAGNFPGEETAYHAYFNSRRLRRKGDVLLRADGRYTYRKIDIAAGPLLIAHLGKDRIINGEDREVDVAGSDGYTLNITGSVGYKFKRQYVMLSGGAPLVVRKNRPDGLTRSAIATLSWQYFFR